MNLVVGEGGRSGQLANTTFRRLNQENGSAELGFDSINALPYSCCIKMTANLVCSTCLWTEKYSRIRIKDVYVLIGIGVGSEGKVCA